MIEALAIVPALVLAYVLVTTRNSVNALEVELQNTANHLIAARSGLKALRDHKKALEEDLMAVALRGVTAEIPCVILDAYDEGLHDGERAYARELLADHFDISFEDSE